MTTLPVLAGTAASIGVIHTLVGIDHTLPFIAIARSQRWSARRTLALTAVCGLGHVLSSVAIGLVGLAAGTAVERLLHIELVRGDIAAWALIVFGLVYAAWAQFRRQHPHHHDKPARPAGALGGWGLFIVFVLGPCEALIPLIMVPGLQLGWGPMALISLVFLACTLATMLAVVGVALLGLQRIRLRLSPHLAEVAAGLLVAASGLAIRILDI